MSHQFRLSEPSRTEAQPDRRRDAAVALTIAFILATHLLGLATDGLPSIARILLTTAIVAALLFLSENLRPLTGRPAPLAEATRIAALAIAAALGPAVAGIVILVAASPVFLLGNHYRATSRQLLTGVAAAQIAALALWAAGAGVESGHSDLVITTLVTTITAGLAVHLIAVALSARTPRRNGHYQDLLLIVPAAITMVALGDAVQRDELWLTSAAVLATLAGLAVAAGGLARSRQDPEIAVRTLVAALDHRHPDTSAHSTRVFELVSRMVGAMHGLDRHDRDAILTASLVHDIGKVATPDQALLKAGALDVEELALIQRHAEIGCEILRHVRSLRASASIVRHHHERWDGAGYPDGLAGAGIPLGARLIAVADTYDAMTHDRIYRPALGHDEAVAEVRSQSGRQFDPHVVALFTRVIGGDETRAEISSRIAS